MKAEIIKQKYPKGFLLFKQWVSKTVTPTDIPKELSTIFPVDKILDSVLEHNSRTLYDFFDQHDLFLNCTTIHKGMNRKQVEEDLFLEGFTQLEKSL